MNRLPPYVKVFPAPTAAQPRNTSPPGEIVDLVNMYNDVLVRVNGGSTLTQALSSHNVTPAMFKRRRLIAETWIADKGEVTKSLKGSKGYGLEELHTRCKKVATSLWKWDSFTFGFKVIFIRYLPDIYQIFTRFYYSS